MSLQAIWEHPSFQVLFYLVLSVSVAGVVRYLWRNVLPLVTRRTRTTLDEQLATYTALPVALVCNGVIQGILHWYKAEIATRR